MDNHHCNPNLPISPKDWVIPPQRYNHDTATIDSARSFIRYALKNRQSLVFQLLKAENTSTGYKLDYRLSFSEPYLAISHAWTDRTGQGDEITVTDLAPWPITMSPSKYHLLDWLFKVQNGGSNWTSWFWMDLFCIDQTKEDELLFSQQLQQIPEVFGNARSCLALLASWPCEYAKLVPVLLDDGAEDTQYDFMCDWLREHATNCYCPALMDAWLTRVWARQEVLYSKRLMIVTANVWLADTSMDGNKVWMAKPMTYKSPGPIDGLRELASCLITWCTKYGFSRDLFSSKVIADVARLLIRGEIVNCPLFDEEDILMSRDSTNLFRSEWFAFNWAMISNGSIRFTTHIRDAILSQMLLVPGYIVPETPWSLPLRDLMANSCKQYRQLLGRFQLVPMIFDPGAAQQRASYLAPMISHSFECAPLCDVLSSVGSACVFPLGIVDITHVEIPKSSFIGYEIDDSPSYRVLQILDIDQDPIRAAKFLATLKPLWSEAERFRISWNVCECLDEIAMEANSETKDLDRLKSALKHCIGRITNTTTFNRVNINSRTKPGKPYSPAEIAELTLPALRAVEISHQGSQIPSYTNLLFGELELGEEGVIWGLGIDKGTKLEFGVAAVEEADGSLRIRASGALLPTVRRNRLQNMSNKNTLVIRPIVCKRNKGESIETEDLGGS